MTIRFFCNMRIGSESKNKHRANGMKNDSLGTGAYIALGEERDSETWLNRAAEQTLHVLWFL